MKNRNVIIAILAILIAVPFFIKSQYMLQSIIMILLYAYWASSWNIIGGFGGQMSLGHATFAGVGAYVSTLFLIYLQVTPWIGMIVGGVIGGALGVLIGYPCFKLKGAYFTLSTIALLNVFQIIIFSQDKIFGLETRGAQGLSVPWISEGFKYMEFLNKANYYYIILALLIIVILVSHWIKNSKMGYYLAAINTNQDAADSLGVNVLSYKLRAQFLSCFFTAVGGTFYAQLITFIDPERLLGYDLSAQIALLAIIGGKGTIFGPIIGAILLEPISQIARSYLGSTNAGLAVVLYGFVFMLTIYYLPDGIEKYFVGIFKRLFRKKYVSKPKTI
jgi:branched-chain amino acid transport system permease protein